MTILSAISGRPLRIGLLIFLFACLTAMAQESAGGGSDSATLGKLLRESRGQANNGNVARQLMVACMREKNFDDGIAALNDFLKSEGAGIRSALLSSRRLNALLTSADALKMLTLCREKGGLTGIHPQTLSWLFSTNTRLGTVVENLSPYDDWGNVLKIIDQLAIHDPAGRDAFLPLILALAIVWDQPRSALHHQTGPYQLPYKPEITQRYDYFKSLYGSRKAGLRIDQLAIQALIFVVDTPVPISELVWARENVRGSTTSWGSKFAAIKYDKARLNRKAYSWAAGPYTLAAIQKLGGICVDQAYYTVMTARAHGIPAMIFSGMGRRGPHAWVGYMKNGKNWEVDVGRYSYDKYATGRSVNPQSNRTMTDHDVEYSRGRALKSQSVSLASRYTRIANAFLGQSEFNAATVFADKAIDLSPLYKEPWDIVEYVLNQQKNDQNLAQLLAKKAVAFKRFPDYLVAIRTAQAKVLRRLGKEAEADRLLRTLANHLGSERGDLAKSVLMNHIDEMVKAGDTAGARRTFEKLLRDNKDEGEKILGLVTTYLQLTKKTDQSREALRFLKIFLNRVSVSAHSEKNLTALKIKAYENAGDVKGAERLRRRGQSD